MGNSDAITRAITMLRSWGADVVVGRDATTNGRPYSFEPVGVIRHHTADPVGTSESIGLRVVHDGRPDVPGPLAQCFVARDGTIHVVSYGRANHAGLGGPWRNVPQDSGNRYLIGVEVDNNGTTEAYPSVQLKAARLLDAALLISLGKDETWLIGHKEWAPGRKVDPRLDMDVERHEVGKIIDAKLAPPPKTDTITVRPGDTLDRLAAALGTTREVLVRLNNIRDPDLIKVGQNLKIPALRIYTVRAGDTLGEIAQAYGTTVDVLVELNRLKDRNFIVAGQQLRLPS